MRISLKPDQQKAMEALRLWAMDPLAEVFFVLRGDAGTGKTSLMNEFCHVMKELKRRSVFGTATTNKAAKVLRLKVPVECRTIHSFLGLKMSDDDEVQQLIGGNDNKADYMDLHGCVVMVDEASMMTDLLLMHLRNFCKKNKASAILLGDDHQLGPVDPENTEMGEESISPIWALDCPTYHLTEIIRYDGPIEKLAKRIREHIDSTTLIQDIDTDLAPDYTGVYLKRGLAFYEWIKTAAERKKFLEPDFGVVLAYTNRQVDYHNNQIRAAMFGRKEAMTQFLVDERVVLKSPYAAYSPHSIDPYLLRNKDEMIVLDAKESTYECDLMGEEISYKITELTGSVEGTEDVVIIPVIHPSEVARYTRDCDDLAAYAKFVKEDKGPHAAKQIWSQFWAHKKIFANVTYAYAMTSHSAQGSTYTTAFVDRENIFSVKAATQLSRMQSLYVSVTRAAKYVVIN